MNIAEKNYEKRANDWRIIYLCNDGDIRVDSYPYKSGYSMFSFSAQASADFRSTSRPTLMSAGLDLA